MTSATLIFAALVFALVLMLSLALLSRWQPDPGRERLARLTAQTAQNNALIHGQTAPASAWQRAQTSLLSALLWLGPWTTGLSGGEGDTPSALRLRFGHAGWRSPVALQIYFISKTLLTLMLPILAWSVLNAQGWPANPMLRLALVVAAAAVGYYLPDAVLKLRIQRRQLELLHAFPDALDLLRLCVQAGLGLDAAIERVGREMRHARPILSEEFALTGWPCGLAHRAPKRFATCRSAWASKTSTPWCPCSSRPTALAPACPNHWPSTPTPCASSAACAPKKPPPNSPSNSSYR
jgi:tight adherence protein C